jgi:predicted MFS family arabinose efflux permease
MVDVSEVALADVAGGRLRVLLARGNLLAYIGDLLGPVILFAVVASGYSWRGAFVVAAVVLVAYAALLALHPLPPAVLEPDAPRPRHVIGQVLRDPRVWSLALLSILLNPLDETVFAFVIAFLQDERGLALSTAGLAVVAANVGGIVALLLTPRLQGRDDDHVLAACGVVLAAAIGAFVVLPPVLALVPLAALGAGVAIGWTVLQHRELTLRPGQAGTTGAVISTISSVEYLAPVAMGAVVDSWGLRAGIVAFAALPLAFAAVAYASIHLSRARLPYRECDAGGPHSNGSDGTSATTSTDAG